MKYDHREISDLNDMELAQAYQRCVQAEVQRNDAKNHFKFNRFENKKAIDLPPVSQLFLDMKNEILKEMKNRGLDTNA